MTTSDKPPSNSRNASREVPLSQAGGRKKLLVAAPSAAIATGLCILGIAPAFTKMLAVILAAYAAVGVAELALGESLLGASKRWDAMPGWKKFVISLVVIIGSMAIAFSVMPLIAELV
jgi:hypothetical protein